MMYERIQGNDMYDAATDVPFSDSVTFHNVLLANPKTASATGVTYSVPILPSSITGLDSSNYALPVSFQFSGGIQQALGAKSVLSVSYVGTQNRHQNYYNNVNLVPYGDLPSLQAGTSSTPYNQLVTYPGFTDIKQAENEANGHYNSLQVDLHANVRNDLTLQFGYTLSRSIDPTTGGGNDFDLDNGTNPYQGWLYDLGPSIFDRTNVGFLNFVYDIPLLRNSPSRGLKTGLGGWQLSAIITAESGAPLNLGVSSQNVSSIVPDSSNRPNVSGSISYPHTVDEWFNPSAFSAPAAGKWGTLGHDALRGPGRDNWDMSLFKNFKFSERFNFSFRADFFNLWNHTQFMGNVQQGGISTSLGAGNFGAITQAYDPRVIQLGLKLTF